MTDDARPRLDQLDVPLKWDRTPAATPPPEPPHRRQPGVPRQARWSRIRLWVAALADLGVVLLSLAATWGVAAALGASLTPLQLAASALAGSMVAAVLGVGALWGWRASPGMLLLNLRFTAPISLGRANRTWIGWLLGLTIAGVPLLVGRRGRTLGERLAGSEIALSQAPESA